MDPLDTLSRPLVSQPLGNFKRKTVWRNVLPSFIDPLEEVSHITPVGFPTGWGVCSPSFSNSKKKGFMSSKNREFCSERTLPLKIPHH